MENEKSVDDGYELGQIAAYIRDWLETGDIVFDQTAGYTFLIDKGNCIVSVPTREEVRMTSHEDGNEEVEGPCRLVMAAVVGRLEALGLIRDPKYYVDDVIKHFSVAATVDTEYGEKRVLLDVGRRRPIDMPVPIDGGPVESNFYEDLENITYEAKMDGENILLRVVINGGEKIKDICYRPLSSDIDEELKIIEEGLMYHDDLVRADFSEGSYRRVDVADTPAGKVRLAIRDALRSGQLRNIIEFD